MSATARSAAVTISPCLIRSPMVFSFQCGSGSACQLHQAHPRLGDVEPFAGFEHQAVFVGPESIAFFHRPRGEAQLVTLGRRGTPRRVESAALDAADEHAL